jgi:hypothetical protein
MNPGAWKFTFDLATGSLHHNNTEKLSIVLLVLSSLKTQNSITQLAVRSLTGS